MTSMKAPILDLITFINDYKGSGQLSSPLFIIQQHYRMLTGYTIQMDIPSLINNLCSLDYGHIDKNFRPVSGMLLLKDNEVGIIDNNAVWTCKSGYLVKVPFNEQDWNEWGAMGALYEYDKVGFKEHTSLPFTFTQHFYQVINFHIPKDMEIVNWAYQVYRNSYTDEIYNQLENAERFDFVLGLSGALSRGWGYEYANTRKTKSKRKYRRIRSKRG